VFTARTEVTDRFLSFCQRHLRAAKYEGHYTDGALIAASSSNRPGPTTLPPTFLRSGSSGGPSSAASSTNTSEPHRSQGQKPVAEFSNPQGMPSGRR
jgi:hypothetical protein